MTPEQDRLLTEREAATYLGVGRQCMSNWRFSRKGPKYVRLGGGKSIRYRAADLTKWISESVVTPGGAP